MVISCLRETSRYLQWELMELPDITAPQDFKSELMVVGLMRVSNPERSGYQAGFGWAEHINTSQDRL